MDDKDIKELQIKIDFLEKENRYLKALLDKNNMPYQLLDGVGDEALFDHNQGARISQSEVI